MLFWNKHIWNINKCCSWSSWFNCVMVNIWWEHTIWISTYFQGLTGGNILSQTWKRLPQKTCDGIYLVITLTPAARLHHVFSKYIVSSSMIAMATAYLCSVKYWQSVGRVFICPCEGVLELDQNQMQKRERDKCSNNNVLLDVSIMGLLQEKIIRRLIHIDNKGQDNLPGH